VSDSSHGPILEALRKGDVATAEALCDAFLRAGGGAEGVYLMGAIHSMKGDKAAAVRLLGRAATLLPKRPDIAYNHGVALRECGKLDAAADEWRRTLGLDPNHRDASANLALALDQLGDPAAAAKAYGRMLERWPDDRDALFNFGNLCQRAGETKGARALYEHLLAKHPAFVAGWVNLGMLGKREGRWAEAEQSYRKAIALDAGSAAAHFNLANLLLQRGRWREGFVEYEWRLRMPEAPRFAFPYPLWTGTETAGTRVLLWGDQGYGDAIQFLRFADALIGRGHRGFAVVKTELRGLAATAPGIEAAFGPGDELPEADVQIALASLPHQLGLAEAGQLVRPPYLRAPVEDPGIAKSGFSVGLVWAGDPRHPNDAHRSARLEDLASLFAVPSVDWFSLQLGPARDQLAASPWASQVTDLAPRLVDFSASAAAVERLDLVVTVDTSTAHLAGALGRPGFVLLPYVDCDWRWLDAGDATPWYPSLRLYRQAAVRDWGSVTDAVAAALAAAAQAKASREA
jgi:tetratricopeptide (TPR) repeat protein